MNLSLFFLIFNFIFEFLLLLLVIFLEGTKWEMGVDWRSYFNFFEVASNWQEQKTRGGLAFEPGFRLYAFTIANLTENYSVFIFITMAFCYSAILIPIFRMTNKSFVSIFYLLTIIPWYSGALRQMIAIGFFTLSLNAIHNRNFWKFFFYILVGFLFHITAILYLPMYFIYNLSWGLFVILYVGAVFLAINSGQILILFDYIFSQLGGSRSYLNYLKPPLAPVNPLLGFMRKFITVGGFYIFGFTSLDNNKEHKDKDNLKFYLMMASFTAVLYLIGIYFIQTIGSRLDMYISIVIFGMAIGIIDTNIRKQSNRILFFLFVVAISLVFYSRLSFLNLFYPYQSIF